MYREMRRKEYQLSDEDTWQIVKHHKFGVLATVTPDNEPRAVAVNYAPLDEHTIILHSSIHGAKIDNLRQNAHASFFILGQQQIKPTEFDHSFESVSIQGHVEFVEDNEDKLKYLIDFTRHVAPENTVERTTEYARPELDLVAVMLLHIDDIKGKSDPKPFKRD